MGNYTNSNGHFDNQKCNSSGINANYILNRSNYSITTGIARHSFAAGENGGLKSDGDLAGAYRPELLPVNLNGASSKMMVLTWQGIQTGSISLKGKAPASEQSDSTALDSLTKPTPPRGKINIAHVFRISSVTRKYTDSNSDAPFYLNTYSDKLNSNDSVKFLTWTNDISLLSDTVHLGKFPLLLKAGVNPDFYRYQYDSLSSYGYAVGLNGKMAWSNQHSSLGITGKWVAVGFSAGDYNLNALYVIRPPSWEGKSEVAVNLFARGCSPDPVIRDFQSNHFRWTNDFLRQNETGLILNWKLTRIRLLLEASLIANKSRIYFDDIGMPAQMNGRMQVLSIKGSKEFSAGPFRSTVSALVQHSTSDKIRLPMFVGSSSTFIHHDISFPKTNGELQIEYGIDLNYSTAFFGYDFMPATGVFFIEDEKALGNYPYLNVFAQMKVKRTRVFVEWCQTFSDLLPEQSFAVLHYPSMRPHLKYGVYWHFYD